MGLPRGQLPYPFNITLPLSVRSALKSVLLLWLWTFFILVRISCQYVYVSMSLFYFVLSSRVLPSSPPVGSSSSSSSSCRTLLTNLRSAKIRIALGGIDNFSGFWLPLFAHAQSKIVVAIARRTD